MTITSSQWDEFIASRQGHLLQSWSWGELKSGFGWNATRVQAAGAGAQILFRRLPLGLTIAYVPKGPVVDWTNFEQCRAVFSTIHHEAKQRRSVFLKVEPHELGANPDGTIMTAAADFLSRSGFTPADTIQPRTSLVIDIEQEDEAILASMKQKTRYNIRLANKKGVMVRQGDAADVATFYDLATVTADRNEFGVHSLPYYQTAFDLFAPDHCSLFIAEFETEPIAALMAFHQGQDAYYFYGASSNQHRNLMATYLIQWAAMRWAKGQGCTRYDMCGYSSDRIRLRWKRNSSSARMVCGAYTALNAALAGRSCRALGRLILFTIRCYTSSINYVVNFSLTHPLLYGIIPCDF